ncbi:PH (Pleckstrin Homology) domain-containing protein [Kineococcus xinjiangensis]|uniref:PH (Pleckstrin Homology) domain-containing protein n=1 Tax=Kineococcus xinjiangensis TaxID=512762 RepID=A0A2S6IFB6_9ACTN|nr:PH domain-containing protein [Kineococcus xinjiangensis]PPK92915.1 PH (Pleckstrin Homology) domain-containing protein [Kineococcus xinjiangensis]
MPAHRAPEPGFGGQEGVPRHEPVNGDERATGAIDIGAANIGAVEVGAIETGGAGTVLPVDVVGPLSRYLLPSERVVVAVRRHPAQLAEPVASVVAGFALVLWLDVVAPVIPYLRDVLWLAWFALLLRTLWRFLEWRADWFIATDRRLLLRYGVLNRRVAMMPVIKVTDMSYNQSLLGRLLHYGEFVMESAGQDQALRVVKWLPVPDRLYLSICAEIFGAERVPPVLPVPGRRRRARRVQR